MSKTLDHFKKCKLELREKLREQKEVYTNLQALCRQIYLIETESEEKTRTINERRAFLQKDLPLRLNAAIKAANVLPSFAESFKNICTEALKKEIEATLISQGLSRVELDQKAQLLRQDKQDAEDILKTLTRDVKKLERIFTAAKNAANKAIEKLKSQIENQTESEEDTDA